MPSRLQAFRWLYTLLTANLLAVELSSAAFAQSFQPRSQALVMAARVDELIGIQHRTHGVTPAPPADDSEILRRLSLDLTGMVPPVSEVRNYLASQDSEKYRILVEQLLNSPAHATHLAQKWRDMMLPRRFDPEQAAGEVRLQNWLRGQFADNKRYDQVVADLLVASGGGESGPTLFYTSLGLKPEELGTTTARLFLGVRLDCAQCHKHPYDHWTQQDFWGYAAFFAQVKQRSSRNSRMQLYDATSGEVRIPDSETIVPPRYLGGSMADKNEGGTRRQQLAIWMVSKENPYLPKATINLAWSHMLGRGLVEPLDDFGDHNPASHPQILDELSEYFVQSQCNLRELYYVLANTKTYQLTSRMVDTQDPPPELFARALVKTLTPEQFYDSLQRATLAKSADMATNFSDPQRQVFLQKLQSQTQSNADFETGVPQALTLLNGPELNLQTNMANGGLLAALKAPFFSNSERVETTFLATLTRPPTAHESAKFVAYLDEYGAENQHAALRDIVWALLNSAEFALNH